MNEKSIALIGAGKLGKGYLADLFQKAGYDIIFMARRQEQINNLRDHGCYHVFLEHENGAEPEVVVYSGYEAWCTTGPERENCVQVLAQVPLASVQVYDNGFEAIGHLLGDAIALRAQQGAGPLDILLVVNYPGPHITFDTYIRQRLSTPEQIAYYEKNVGLVRTLAYRGGYAAPDWLLAKDPEAITASDYPELPVDGEAFRGEIPQVEGIIPLDNIDARLKAKLWAGNMRGGVMACLAQTKGYTMAQEANEDAHVKAFCKACYEESVYGILNKFHMTYEDFQKSERKVMPLLPGMEMRLSTDTLARQMNGLARKLGRQERLVGPAMTCLEMGRIPFFLAKAIALAFGFRNDGDPTSAEILGYVEKYGVREAAQKYCGLSAEEPLEAQLLELICAHYRDLQMAKL